jgi:hypothetical protein
MVIVNTLRALHASGHEPLLVSPFDPTRDDRDQLTVALRDFCEPYLVAAVPRPLGRSIIQARAAGLPITIGRHTLPAVRDEVERLLARHPCAVVHAEQLQALPQCEPARRRALPIVLRAQNVESSLWLELATWWPLVRGVVRREAARLARYEGHAVREAAATIALTEGDAERLRVLSDGGGPVYPVAVPFPDRLPSATVPLTGEPAVVVLASGWLPNRDGARWFSRTWWPHVRAHCPRAVLHLFGTGPGIQSAPTVVVHAPLVDSREAFSPGAILAVPLRLASGVRIKILEAWARGVPVVATPQAAAGLAARHEEELLIAEDPPGFARAIARLHADPAFARASVEAGRALLRARHDPIRIAAQLTRIYAEVARRSSR